MEAEFVRWLRHRLDQRATTSIGDDAAIIDLAGQQLVVTTDALSDGVDFHLCEVDPERIGRKALAVNLSDLAAMAAEPLAVVVTLTLPTRRGDDLLSLAQSLYEGMLPLAEEFGAPIVGGDTNIQDVPLVSSATVIGKVPPFGPRTRTGGRPGDRLLVTGTLGGSIFGHHLDFTPRVREALQLNADYDLHAGMDISDGLALDTSRLAEASGCGAVIDVQRVPISAAARTLDNPLSGALGDGEDFELLLALAPDVAPRVLKNQPLECGLTDIGELVEATGLWQRDGAGVRSPLEPTGWKHE